MANKIISYHLSVISYSGKEPDGILDRQTKTALLLAAGLAVSLALAVAFGSESLSFSNLTDEQRTILFDIRIPRVLLAACVGASLAAAGAGLQSLLRNPLAEPYLLGVSNGAALGTMLAFVFFESFRMVAACSGVCGCRCCDICRLSDSSDEGRDECRTAGAFGRDRDDVFVVDHRAADQPARRGKTPDVHVLAAGRSFAVDAERVYLAGAVAVVGTMCYGRRPGRST